MFNFSHCSSWLNAIHDDFGEYKTQVRNLWIKIMLLNPSVFVCVWLMIMYVFIIFICSATRPTIPPLFRDIIGPYADYILIPLVSTGSLVVNPKFQLQILCTFGDMTKNVKLIGIPENNFLCVFLIASPPGVHTFFCLWRVNKNLPQGETSQKAFQRSRSINYKWKIYMLKWSYPSLRQQSWNHSSVKVYLTVCKMSYTL